jgi:hypothetical protein
MLFDLFHLKNRFLYVDYLGQVQVEIFHGSFEIFLKLQKIDLICVFH